MFPPFGFPSAAITHAPARCFESLGIFHRTFGQYDNRTQTDIRSSEFYSHSKHGWHSPCLINSQARGKEALRGPAYHQRLLPAYTKLKFRQPGQGGDADGEVRDLRAELLAAEAAHYAKTHGHPTSETSSTPEPSSAASKRALEITSQAEGDEDPEAKRRRILEETRDIDADDSEEDDEDDDSNSDSDDDEDDEVAELQRELEKIKRERAEKREREVRRQIDNPLSPSLLIPCTTGT